MAGDLVALLLAFSNKIAVPFGKPAEPKECRSGTRLIQHFK
jgi:hypothetical protein